ncbi:hypothetical protein RB601_004651 [Gaeumannomyces tritici]
MPSPSSRRRSLRPNLHSGVPERYARMIIWPVTSARRTEPVADMRRFTSSMTSTKASFLRYLTSALRHESAPVACMVILAESSGRALSDLTPSVVMYILSVSVSLVDKHKVVLDGLLVELAKVPPPQLYQAVQELEDEGGIGVALGNSHQVDVLVLYMAEGGAAQRQDGRADLGVGDDLDAEDVGEARAAVVAEGAEDQVLALLVDRRCCSGRVVHRSASNTDELQLMLAGQNPSV